MLTSNYLGFIWVTLKQDILNYKLILNTLNKEKGFAKL